MNRCIIIAIASLLLVQSIGAANPLTSYCTATGSVKLLAPWYCSQINQAAATVWASWEPLGLAVTMLSFTIAAVIFMFGVALHNDRLRIFGIGEIYEATATALIVLLFSFMAAVMFGLLPGFFVGPIDPYNTSLTYISHLIGATGTLTTEIFQIGALDYFYASQQIIICAAEANDECGDLTAIFPSAFRFGVLYGFFWPAWTFLDLTNGGFIALHVEFYAILFFMYAAIPAFLIPGIIFRAILPTRHLGGMMMAIAIGFYFIMPILFSVTFYFTTTGPGNPLSSIEAVTGALERYGSGSNAITGTISPASPLVEAMGGAKSLLGDFWLSVLFYPALISAITYALIVQIAELIGGMARTSGRIRGI